MIDAVVTHDEVILAKTNPIGTNDQCVYLRFYCELDRVNRLNLDYFFGFDCHDGWFLFSNLRDLLINVCFEVPPDNHTIFTTSHKPVFAFLGSWLYLRSFTRLSVLDLTSNSTSSFVDKKTIVFTNWHWILRLSLCFFQILQEEVVVVVVELYLAHESSMA